MHMTTAPPHAHRHTTAPPHTRTRTTPHVTNVSNWTVEPEESNTDLVGKKRVGNELGALAVDERVVATALAHHLCELPPRLRDIE